MTMIHGSGVLALDTEGLGTLVFRPIEQQATVMQVTDVVYVGDYAYTAPIVTGTQGSAAWTPETGAIVPANPSVAQVRVIPAKVTVATQVSREQESDASVVADIISRTLVAEASGLLDESFFGTKGADLTQPDGLYDVTGRTQIDLAAAFTNLDAFADAMAVIEDLGRTPDALVVAPDVRSQLRKLKAGSGSNQPILGTDPTRPGGETVFGVPIYVNNNVDSGEAFLLNRESIRTVLRQDAEIARDASVNFLTDEIVYKLTLRVAWAYTHPATIVHLSAPDAG